MSSCIAQSTFLGRTQVKSLSQDEVVGLVLAPLRRPLSPQSSILSYFDSSLPRTVMKALYVRVIGFCLLSRYGVSLNPTDGATTSSFFDKHGVQCHHESSSKIDFGSGQESRLDPSRQYLPQPEPLQPFNTQNNEEAAAALSEEPNLSVENTFVSPTLQNNYKSLFRENKNQDSLSTSAAQGVPANGLLPSAPRKTNNNKHTEEGEEISLDRLCKDAFHSFLCKPIKGPRKTPTGRLRPNAILPPDVLAGLSSFQDITRLRPDNSGSQGVPNNVGPPFSKPTTKAFPFQPNHSNQFPQRSSFPQLFFTTQQTPTAHPSVPTFPKTYPYNIPDNPAFPSPTNDNPAFPSPTNENPQIIKPHGFGNDKSHVSLPPETSSPSNHNLHSITLRPTYQTITFRPTTQRTYPTSAHSFDKYFIPFSNNNVPKYAQTPQSNTEEPGTLHDCDKNPIPSFPTPLVPKPSNNEEAVARPFIIQSPKSAFKNFNELSKVPSSSNNLPNVAPLPQINTQNPFTSHNCDKKPVAPLVPNPSNNNLAFARPFIPQSPKPVFNSFNESPKVPSPSSNLPTISSPPPIQYPESVATHDCEKHKVPYAPLSSNTNNQNPVYLKLHNQPTQNPFIRTFTESPKLPLPSNNIAQILAQPQQTQSDNLLPKTHSGYVYDKPSIPFNLPVGYPSIENPVTQKPYQESFTFRTSTSRPTSQYAYDQTRIPFASHNVAHIIAHPTQPKIVSSPRPFITTTAKPSTPCEHDKSRNPTNQDIVVFKPGSTSNSYINGKPMATFPSETSRPTNQNFKPFVTSSVKPAYTYNKSSNPFLQTNPTNSFPSIVRSPTNNGRNSQKTDKPFPAQTNLSANNNYFASQYKPSSTFKPFSTETTATPEYSYNKLSNSLVSPESTNQNLYVAGYSYPKPAIPFLS